MLKCHQRLETLYTELCDDDSEEIARKAVTSLIQEMELFCNFCGQRYALRNESLQALRCSHIFHERYDLLSTEWKDLPSFRIKIQWTPVHQKFNVHILYCSMFTYEEANIARSSVKSKFKNSATQLSNFSGQYLSYLDEFAIAVACTIIWARKRIRRVRSVSAKRFWWTTLWNRGLRAVRPSKLSSDRRIPRRVKFPTISDLFRFKLRVRRVEANRHPVTIWRLNAISGTFPITQCLQPGWNLVVRGMTWAFRRL